MKCKSAHYAILPVRSQQTKQNSDYYICLLSKEDDMFSSKFEIMFWKEQCTNNVRYLEVYGIRK